MDTKILIVVILGVVAALFFVVRGFSKLSTSWKKFILMAVFIIIFFTAFRLAANKLGMSGERY